MKLSISVTSNSRGRIIFNPAPTKETDRMIRGPQDARKVLQHFQKFAKLQFPIRTWRRDAPNDEVVFSAMAEVLATDNDKATRNFYFMEEYLKHNKWKARKKHQGKSVWTHPKLSYLTVIVTPITFTKRGVGFTVEAIGLETKAWRKKERERLGKNLGPKTNKIHERYLKEHQEFNLG